MNYIYYLLFGSKKKDKLKLNKSSIKGLLRRSGARRILSKHINEVNYIFNDILEKYIFLLISKNKPGTKITEVKINKKKTRLTYFGNISIKYDDSPSFSISKYRFNKILDKYLSDIKDKIIVNKSCYDNIHLNIENKLIKKLEKLVN